MKKIRIGFITSSLETLNLDEKSQGYDSTVELLRYGQKKYDVKFIDDESVHYIKGQIFGHSYDLKGKTICGEKNENLNTFDILFIRKDPPFDASYLTLMQLLCAPGLANSGTKIINSPTGLLKYNEKSSVMYFPEFTAKSLITSSEKEILDFFESQKNGIILKGLDNKGGSNIFKLKKGDPNTNEIIRQITKEGSERVMCQEYLSIESTGDKRVTVLDGKLVGGFLRTPKKGDYRGNICKGATAKSAEPNEKEAKMALDIAKEMLKDGIYVIGVDFIGGKCTEINITSPLIPERFMPGIEKEFYSFVEKQCKQR